MIDKQTVNPKPQKKYLKIINRKTISEGVLFTLGRYSRPYLRCNSTNLITLSRSAAELLKLNEVDYIEFLVDPNAKRDVLYIKKSTEKVGFRIVRHPEKEKYIYRMTSVKLSKFIKEKYNSNAVTMVFEKSKINDDVFRLVTVKNQKK